MNRYGITVDRTKSEIEQIAQLRAEHLRQYPSIVMKNPDFAHLRDFIVSHSLNQSDMMREAPDKIKVLIVMKDLPGFEYADTVLNSYVIGYNSFTLKPRDFIKWLVAEFPRNFDWSLKQCKNPAVGEYISEQTSWMSAPFAATDRSGYRFDLKSADAISNKTRAYCVINRISEFPKCATCGKTLIANVKSVFDGFRNHCDGSCSALNPSVQARTGETCLANFGSETYLGSAEGVETKKRRLTETYGVDHYSGTDEWRAKVRAKSMRDYGVEWPSQNPETRKKASESLKIAAKEYTTRAGKTQRARRGGKFWTDDERERISNANKSPENQRKRIERARKRHTGYYCVLLCTNDYVRPLFSLEEFLAVPYRKLPTTDLAWECQKCGAVFNGPLNVFYIDGKHDARHKTYARCPQCYPNRRKSSLEERQVKEFMESELPTGLEIVYGRYENFKTIRPFQLDIIVKDKASGLIVFAVEFDGVKWHSVENSDNINKQLRKTVRCEELRIPLIHVFEDEWLYDAERTKDLLRTYMSGEFKNLKFGESRISVDRSKFCKAVLIPGYRLVEETLPEVIERKGLESFGQHTYGVPDCGKLIYERIRI